MAKATLALLGLCCLASLARAQQEAASAAAYVGQHDSAQEKGKKIKLPAFGGYDCAGRITKIWCREDEHGMLSDIAYYNDYTGYHEGCNRAKDWGYYDKGYSGKLFLSEHENIIKIEACRGGKYGYTSVAFFTDSNRKLICGRGAFDYVPDGYEKFSQAYRSYAFTDAYGQSPAATAGDSKSSAGRALLQAQPQQASPQQASPQQGAEPQGAEPQRRKDKKGDYSKDGGEHGWGGWKSKCQTYISPRQPRWIEDSDEWYKRPDLGYYGGKDDKTGGTYYKYGGKNYYKSFADFEKEEKKHKSDGAEYKEDEPGYYYNEVLPLSRFKLYCDYLKNVYAIYGFCWNGNYHPRVQLRIKFIITLNAEDAMGRPLGCPKTRDDIIALKDSLTTLSDNLVVASGGIIKEIDWDKYDPHACTTSCDPYPPKYGYNNGYKGGGREAGAYEGGNNDGYNRPDYGGGSDYRKPDYGGDYGCNATLHIWGNVLAGHKYKFSDLLEWWNDNIGEMGQVCDVEYPLSGGYTNMMVSVCYETDFASVVATSGDYYGDGGGGGGYDDGKDRPGYKGPQPGEADKKGGKEAAQRQQQQQQRQQAPAGAKRQ